MFHSIVRGLAVLFGAVGLMTEVATAASSLVYVTSNYPYTVELKFYSKTRNHVWPDANRVWVLDDDKTYVFNLGCQRGEKICYGAWPQGNIRRYWGTGYNATEGCDTCCFICGNDGMSYELN